LRAPRAGLFWHACLPPLPPLPLQLIAFAQGAA